MNEAKQATVKAVDAFTAILSLFSQGAVFVVSYFRIFMIFVTRAIRVRSLEFTALPEKLRVASTLIDGCYFESLESLRAAFSASPEMPNRRANSCSISVNAMSRWQSKTNR